jgi:hypothetical protein
LGNNTETGNYRIYRTVLKKNRNLKDTLKNTGFYRKYRIASRPATHPARKITFRV